MELSCVVGQNRSPSPGWGRAGLVSKHMPRTERGPAPLGPVGTQEAAGGGLHRRKQWQQFGALLGFMAVLGWRETPEGEIRIVTAQQR